MPTTSIGLSLKHSVLPAPPTAMVAYLLSEYPVVYDSYLLHEVRQLRAMGWKIQTLSIRRPLKLSVDASAAEEEETHSTWYVLDSSMLTHLTGHLVTLVTRPVRYFGGLLAAWKFAGHRPLQLIRPTAYFCEAICAGHLLRKAGITYVHSVYTTTVAVIMARIFDFKLSMTLHGSAEFVDPEGFAIRQKVRIAERTCAISYFGRSQVMLSCDVADWRKLHVTPLGVDTAIWRPGEFRKAPSPFELLTVGRLSEAKGYPCLLDAIAALAHLRRDFRLTVVGDGPRRASLEDRAAKLGIADRVLFEGWLGQDELRQHYCNSDLFVLSSFAEGLPVVLMEAMATGVPCVAPRIAGIPELIRDGTDGLLFLPSNIDELTAHIACLMNNVELRASMSVSSRERITDKYDLLKNTLRLSDMFREWMIPCNARSVANPEVAAAEPHSA